jgi:protein-tyrosine phosphatase
MASGRLFRSAAPGRLDPSGAAALRALGLTTIIDLRGVAEAASHPTIAPEDDWLDVVAAPVEPKASAIVRQALVDGSATSAMMRGLMIQSYRAYVTDAANAFGDALNALLTTDEPTLVHCTAGKDRTGFIVALIQTSLGAHEDDVFADYLRTNQDWDRASVAAHLPLESEAIAPILVADADYLAAAFEEIERHDGSIMAFIQRATGGRVTRQHFNGLIEGGQSA